MTDVYAPQSPSDSRQYVKSFAADGTANFAQVQQQEISYQAIFGKASTSTTSNAIEYGVKTYTLDDEGEFIQVGYPLQCTSLDDSQCFQQGVCTRKDLTTSPCEIGVTITIVSALVNTSENWEIAVIPVAGFSTQPSATVGISTSEIDASGAGPFTCVTQSGRLFMEDAAIGGTVVCAALADPKTYLFARIVANETDLVVSKIYSNATGAVDAWSIQLFDGPDTGWPYKTLSGYTVTRNSATELRVTPGTVRDYADEVDLVYPGFGEVVFDISSAFTHADGGYIQSADLSGTITSVGDAVTGTGTLFVDAALGVTATGFASNDFTNAGQLLDVLRQAGSGAVSLFQNDSIISSGGVTTRVYVVSSDTFIRTVSDLGVTGATYKRGGWVASGTAYYGFMVVRRDSDGALSFGTTAYTGSWEPDLPAGYSRFRTLAVITVVDGDITEIVQPLLVNVAPTSADYLVKTSNPYLSAERVVTDTDSIVWDWGTAGQAKANAVQWLAVASGSLSGSTVSAALPDGYSNCRITVIGGSLDTATRAIIIRVSTDGGSNYDSTAANYTGGNIFFNGASLPDVATTASLTPPGDLTAAQTAASVATLSGYSGAGYKQYFCNTLRSTGDNRARSGFYASTDAITNIQILINGSGNFDDGTYVIEVS